MGSGFIVSTLFFGEKVVVGDNLKCGSGPHWLWGGGRLRFLRLGSDPIPKPIDPRIRVIHALGQTLQAFFVPFSVMKLRFYELLDLDLEFPNVSKVDPRQSEQNKQEANNDASEKECQPGHPEGYTNRSKNPDDLVYDSDHAGPDSTAVRSSPGVGLAL
jgi:hypothetical protein